MVVTSEKIVMTSIYDLRVVEADGLYLFAIPACNPFEILLRPYSEGRGIGHSSFLRVQHEMNASLRNKLLDPYDDVGQANDELEDRKIIDVGGRYYLVTSGAVVFAGKACFNEGELIYWNNDSGHYRPHKNAVDKPDPMLLRVFPKEKFSPPY